MSFLTNASGHVTDRYDYDAFGNTTSRTGETENNYLYCSEQFDSTTGLYYLRARYMNPSTGTFISMDAYQGSVYDPASLHKYLYANANPVMYSDPSGYSATKALPMPAAKANAGDIRVVMAQMYVSMSQSAAKIGMLLLNELTSLLATTGFTSVFILLTQNPTFVDMTYSLTSGKMSIKDFVREINDAIVDLSNSLNELVSKIEEAYASAGDYSGGSTGGGSSPIPPNDPNWLQQLAETLNSLNQNKINHIINGSKGSNHHWERLSPSKDWNEIKPIIENVLRCGQDVVYNGNIPSKIMSYNGESVQVVYTIVDNALKISDAWVIA